MHQIPRRASPRNVERSFGSDEIFFSTTDRKGIIRSGNRVFVRVSGHARRDLVGSPHNLIRHPDMPRTVFKLLWEEIEAGRPVAAYVKNLARDGAYYWVLAMVVPCEGGYLSVRIKPSTPYFEVVQTIYADLLAVERQYEQANPRHRDGAMAASRERLGVHLQAAGFADYATFIRTALLAEVSQRGARRAAATTPSVVAVAAQPGARSSLHELLTASEALDGFLRALVARLDAYVALHHTLGQQAQFTQELSDDVQLFSLNALLAATRLQDEGAALGAVAALIKARSDQSTPLFRDLTDAVLRATDLLDGLLLPVAIAAVQSEALAGFLRELLQVCEDEDATVDDLGALATCLTDGVEIVASALQELERRLRALTEHTDTLQHALRTMRALELNGRIEAARVPHARGVVTLFQSIAEKLSGALHEISELRHASTISFASEIRGAASSRDQLQVIRELVAALAGRSGTRPARVAA